MRDVELLRRQAESDPQGDPAQWREAAAAAEHAFDLLGPLADARLRRYVQDLRDELRHRAGAAEVEARLLREVVDIRSAEADDHDGSASDATYAAAFHDAAIDVNALGPEAIGARIRSRPAGVALALAAALDHWAGRRRLARPDDEAGWRRLVAAARASDPDPIRDRLRVLWARADRHAPRQPLLELASQADPREWPAASLLLLAEALHASGSPDAAVALLRRAVAHQPGDVWLSYRLASWLEAMPPSRMEEAIGYYQAARALRPQTAHELAHLLEARGRGEEAAAVFEDLVNRQPANGRHWACYGRLLRDRGDARAAATLEKAVAACREAIRDDRHLAADHVNLGVALSAQGMMAEAAAEFRKAIQTQPTAMMARTNLGSALCELGQLDQAVTVLREAVRLRPDIAVAHSQLGVALIRQGKADDAIAAFREAIRLRPGSAEAHANLANALQDRGLHDEALATIRAAIRLKPDDALAHYNLGNFLRDRGKADDAIAAYRESIRLRPDYSWAYNNLGAVLFQPKHDLAGGRGGLPRGDPVSARLRQGLRRPRPGPDRAGPPRRGRRRVSRGDPDQARPAWSARRPGRRAQAARRVPRGARGLSPRPRPGVQATRRA